MAWVYLVIAGLFEIGFTTCLKLSDGFTKVIPSILFFTFSALSFYMLMKAMRDINLGTAYAVWTGIGALGTAVVGMLFFKDPATMARIALLLVIIGAVIGLKLVSVEPAPAG